MLFPSTRFDLPFTCLDASGLPASPTGTPTAVLVKNGTDLGTTVTVTMTGAQGVASCTLPSDAAAGDRFYLRVSAVVSGSTFVAAGPADSIASPGTLTGDYDAAKTAAAAGAAMTLTSGERITLAGAIEAGFLDDLTGGAFLAGVQAQLEALFDSGVDVPVVTIASTVASAVRTNLAVELARIDAAISSRLATAGYTAPPSVAGLATSAEVDALSDEIAAIPTTGEIAAALLITPANKLLTDADGEVTATNGGGGSSGGTYILPVRSSIAGRVMPNRVELFIRELIPLTITIVDSRGTPIDCTGLTADLYLQDMEPIEGLSPTGTPPHQYTFTASAELTTAAGAVDWALRVNDATLRVLAYGVVGVSDVP